MPVHHLGSCQGGDHFVFLGYAAVWFTAAQGPFLRSCLELLIFRGVWSRPSMQPVSS